MMPVKDGFKFREEQLQEEAHKAVPVVIMSADGNVSEKKARIMAQDYIRKPVDINTYLNVVKRYCG
jgi:CheY-like chemotaxis protein